MKGGGGIDQSWGLLAQCGGWCIVVDERTISVMAADGNSGEYIFRECGVVEQSKHWNQKNLGPLCPQGCEARIN